MTMIKIAHSLFFIFLIFFNSTICFAVEPDEMLSDNVLEKEARIISSKLRCPVCQNQTIDDSDSQIAIDLRKLVRDRLKQGQNENEILNFIKSRYGNYILLEPEFNKTSYILWLFPIIFILSSFLFVYLKLK